jgi:hypothetical protein
MSRCGSTVISQMLASLEENVMVSEAGPVDALARAHLRAPLTPEEQRIEWLQWMVSALGQRRAGKEARYFLKLDARTTFELPLLRKAFPQVPWIFLYRDPVEVLVSLVNRPSSMTTPGMGENLLHLPMSEIADMAMEEYAARVLGRLCEEAARQFPSRQGMLVNYRQIPESVWSELPGHFGFPLASEAIERMQQAAGWHAKEPGRRFEADSARRQSEASEKVRLAAEQWVAPQYARLEELRLQGVA